MKDDFHLEMSKEQMLRSIKNRTEYSETLVVIARNQCCHCCSCLRWAFNSRWSWVFVQCTLYSSPVYRTNTLQLWHYYEKKKGDLNKPEKKSIKFRGQQKMWQWFIWLFSYAMSRYFSLVQLCNFCDLPLCKAVTPSAIWGIHKNEYNESLHFVKCYDQRIEKRVCDEVNMDAKVVAATAALTKTKYWRIAFIFIGFSDRGAYDHAIIVG